jgi:hypothetical protein
VTAAEVAAATEMAAAAVPTTAATAVPTTAAAACQRRTRRHGDGERSDEGQEFELGHDERLAREK